MNMNKRGYWVYSIIAIIIFVALFGFWGYLIYDLIIKLSARDLSNNTVVQALISLIVTVFIGGWFSKKLEIKNAKKLELFKIQKEISISVIDYATILYYHPDDQKVRELLVSESQKVKLYFNNEVLLALNNFVEKCDEKGKETERKSVYERLINELKAVISM